MAKHNSNTIIKFADDTTVLGLITDNNETAYREEVRDLAVLYQDNNLSLNVSKTKELIVYYRKRRAEHALLWTVPCCPHRPTSENPVTQVMDCFLISRKASVT
jgi:hypothetical protein